MAAPAVPSPAFERAQRAARDGGRLRVVRRARLLLASREAEHAVRFALEDALNTADFGDTGRLVVVHSLRLGKLRERVSPYRMARAIEDAWRRVASTAVSADEEQAAKANAVWFTSTAAARLSWLKRIVHHAPVDAWYWRAALPEAGARPLSAALAAVLLAAYDENPDLAADELRSWSPAALRRLIALLPEAPPTASSVQPASAPIPASHAKSAALAEPRAGALPSPSGGIRPKDWRLDWLRELRVELPADPRHAPVPPLPEARQTAGNREPNRGIIAPSAADAVVESPSPARDAPRLRIAEPVHGLSATPGPPATIHRQLDSIAAKKRPKPVRETKAAAASIWPWWTDAQPSAHGGLLMLLHVLDAIGFDRWLAGQPRELRAPFVAQLFARLGDITRMPHEDPQRLLFPLDPVLPMESRAWLRIWCAAVRRALRRRTGLALKTVVCREGGVAITRTHVDVVFALDAVDLRLRRRGLDADPGWVPWFAHVVTFHYV